MTFICWMLTLLGSRKYSFRHESSYSALFLPTSKVYHRSLYKPVSVCTKIFSLLSFPQLCRIVQFSCKFVSGFVVPPADIISPDRLSEIQNMRNVPWKGPANKASMLFWIVTHLHTQQRNYEGMLISPSSDKEGNKLQWPNSEFIQHTPHEAQYTS